MTNNGKRVMSVVWRVKSRFWTVMSRELENGLFKLSVDNSWTTDWKCKHFTHIQIIFHEFPELKFSGTVGTFLRPLVLKASYDHCTGYPSCSRDGQYLKSLQMPDKLTLQSVIRSTLYLTRCVCESLMPPGGNKNQNDLDQMTCPAIGISCILMCFSVPSLKYIGLSILQFYM